MRTINIILCFLLSIISSAYGQDIPGKYADLLHKIQRINRDSTLQKVSLENDAFLGHASDGGGLLTGYFKMGKIQKITKSIGISIGIETYDYYFENEKLLFIYEIFRGFVVDDSTGVVNFEKTGTNFIGRYYFRDNKLVDNETTGHNRFEDDAVDMEGALLAETKENIKLLKKARAGK